MKLLKPLIILSALYLLVGPALMLMERQFSPDSEVVVIAYQIIGIATGFWAFTFAELKMTALWREQKGNSLVGTYIAFKGARFLLTAMALFAYGFLGGASLLLFGINLIVFFLLTMVFTTLHHLKEEKKLKNKA